MATYERGNVSANCPGCDGAITTFEQKTGGHTFGLFNGAGSKINETTYATTTYMMLRCAGCGRGGLAVVCSNHGYEADGVLKDFYPVSVDSARVPETVPRDILAEFREGELCAAHGAHRAASALMRSVLEKTLKASGYTTGSLKAKIDDISSDGIITENRRDRAQEGRELGNDILHDAWRSVSPDEYEAAHHYTQRILEDLYDDRPSIEDRLRGKGRID